MRRSLLGWSIVLLFASAGCGKVQVDLGEAPSINPIPQALDSNGEFVAAAQKGRVTSRGYVIDSALGSVLSRTETETSNGFKVFSTVQGKLQSEEALYR